MGRHFTNAVARHVEARRVAAEKQAIREADRADKLAARRRAKQRDRGTKQITRYNQRRTVERNLRAIAWLWQQTGDWTGALSSDPRTLWHELERVERRRVELREQLNRIVLTRTRLDATP